MTRRSIIGLVCVALLAAFVVGAVSSAGGSKGQDWPQFRGVHRDGISPETGLLRSWPEGGPTEVWRRPLGPGYSGISVVGDRVYTAYAADEGDKGTEFAAAFDAATGKELWRTRLGDRYDNQFGNGPRATPVVDGDMLFVLGSYGDMVALSTKDGTERWRVSLTETFGTQVPTFGFSTSALVDGDQVVLESGGPEGKSYTGLSKKTGETKWTTGDAERAGYNSPLLVEMNGKKRYVYIQGEKLRSIDSKGEEVWSYDWPQGETHAMPVFVAPDMIFASGVEGVGATLLRISEKGGEATVEEVWKTRFMRNHFSSSVVHDGHVYGFDNATLKCMSLQDAELAWAKRGLGKGSLILADGHLIVLSDQGRLLLLEASGEGYVEKGSVQALEGRCWTAPTLSHGRLYLRNHDELVVYDVKG